MTFSASFNDMTFDQTKLRNKYHATLCKNRSHTLQRQQLVPQKRMMNFGDESLQRLEHTMPISNQLPSTFMLH